MSHLDETKNDIGLGNVDNTSDANKPVSTAQASADATVASASNANLSAHTSNTSNPHTTTKAQVGLGNVDNTTDVSKPVSTLQQVAIDKLKPYPLSVMIGASGQAIIYLTTNGLIGGTAIFASITGVSLDFTSNNPNFGKSYSISGVTLTVTATQQTFSTGLAGILAVLTGVTLSAAPNGTTLAGWVEGVRN